MARILIVEDDIGISNMLTKALSYEGYTTDAVCTGEEGERLAAEVPYDLILLDIILPGKDGFEVCKALRNQKVKTLILMLTAKKEESDIIRGLDSGADDHLSKPFHISVLASRIRPLIRRGQNLPNPKIGLNNLIIDTITHQVWLGTEIIILTPTEYAILECLAAHPDCPVTRSAIEKSLWNLDKDNCSNVIDAHIKNLRAKLGEENRDLIQTLRGQGYQLNSK